VSSPVQESRLRIGDRVRFSGSVRTVIGLSGTVVRLADPGGAVTEVRLAELVAAGDFERVGVPPPGPLPSASPLDGLPDAAVAEALWWERHIVEVLRGIPPDAPPGTSPRPEYDPQLVSLTRREQAKAAELRAAGRPVTASAVKQRRRRYQAGGLAAMADRRAARRTPPYGRADQRVVEAIRQAIGEATDASTRTASYIFWRAGQILDAEHGAGTVELPSRAGLYRLFAALSAGRHTTGSARTRRSLAARPDGPFSQLPANAPGEVMEIDSTPLDVMVRLDDGVEGRVELTGMVDVATRTVTAVVLQPTTRSADASVLLARTVTPEPMRPGWAKALAMSASALPHRRLSDIDARLEAAAARPVIIPDTIVIDHGKVFVSRNFRASCAFLGISLQPARKATGTDKPHIERTLGSVASLFAQFAAGYAGRSPEYRGRGAGQQAVWSLLELQELLDEWIIAAWQNRPHDGLRDPAHPGRAFTPNEKYAAMVEAAGYVPVALSAGDYIELLPARWQAINAYGIKVSRRTYDGQELNPFRQQPSGVKEHKNRWEIHYDPYDVSRIWVRDHWNGGWIIVFWTQLHRVAAPFGELAWDHARSRQPGATEDELAGAVADLLQRAGRGPGDPAGETGQAETARRDRRVAARTKAAQPLPIPGDAAPQPGDSAPAACDPGASPGGGRDDGLAEVIPMPIFDPFAEADKPW
jgi:Mu transposase, C-terminal